jgi:hypothetical protein
MAYDNNGMKRAYYNQISGEYIMYEFIKVGYNYSLHVCYSQNEPCPTSCIGGLFFTSERKYSQSYFLDILQNYTTIKNDKCVIMKYYELYTFFSDILINTPMMPIHMGIYENNKMTHYNLCEIIDEYDIGIYLQRILPFPQEINMIILRFMFYGII